MRITSEALQGVVKRRGEVLNWRQFEAPGGGVYEQKAAGRAGKDTLHLREAGAKDFVKIERFVDSVDHAHERVQLCLRLLDARGVVLPIRFGHETPIATRTERTARGSRTALLDYTGFEAGGKSEADSWGRFLGVSVQRQDPKGLPLVRGEHFGSAAISIS